MNANQTVRRDKPVLSWLLLLFLFSGISISHEDFSLSNRVNRIEAVYTRAKAFHAAKYTAPFASKKTQTGYSRHIIFLSKSLGDLTKTACKATSIRQILIPQNLILHFKDKIPASESSDASDSIPGSLLRC